MIYFAGKVELSKCLPAGYEPKVLFTWEIQAVGINLDVTDKSRLYIPPGLLQGGEVSEYGGVYRVKCGYIRVMLWLQR